MPSEQRRAEIENYLLFITQQNMDLQMKQPQGRVLALCRTLSSVPPLTTVTADSPFKILFSF